MKSLQEFIAENLDKLVLTTAQKTKDKSVGENAGGKKAVAENQEVSFENRNQKTEKLLY